MAARAAGDADAAPPERQGNVHPVTGRPKHNILMVSDFFYPNVGGVEQHMFQLAQFLIRRGHKVVMMTHAYGERAGVRWLTNGLKVYYIPQQPFYNGNSLPTIYGAFPILYDTFIRERIDIVHCHQAFSNLAHEAIFHAGTMGITTCFTDHSLFGFADASGILMNKLLKFTLSDINHVICVSHTGKENTVLRARLNPSDVSVIPNAVDTRCFTPDPLARPPDYRERLNVVIISRLVYRKGMDLVAQVLPVLCERHPQMHFIIGGDGPKKLVLEETVQKYRLHDRVEFLGAVESKDVRDVLIRGHIFLNCSLTEAFCIAILEAAACGLLVVATKVGGVPEVLPPDMIVFAEANASDLVRAVEQTLPRIPGMDHQRIQSFHERVKAMYSWENVAERTEKVYQRMKKHSGGSGGGGHSGSQPESNARLPLIERFRRYYGCGPWAGKLFVLVVALDYLLLKLLEWCRPREDIDIAIDFPFLAYGADRSAGTGHRAPVGESAGAGRRDIRLARLGDSQQQKQQ